MANKFLARYKNDDEEKDYVPRQRGLGRRVFEGIAKKAKKYKKDMTEEWTEPEGSNLSPQNPKDWREMRARRGRDLSLGRPPTYEDAEESMRETGRPKKLKELRRIKFGIPKPLKYYERRLKEPSPEASVPKSMTRSSRYYGE